eukprot:6197141-Pleurochrysis_carterae.AAC.2
MGGREMQQARRVRALQAQDVSPALPACMRACAHHMLCCRAMHVCSRQINGKYHLDTHQAVSWGAYSLVRVMRPCNKNPVGTYAAYQVRALLRHGQECKSVHERVWMCACTQHDEGSTMSLATC